MTFEPTNRMISIFFVWGLALQVCYCVPWNSGRGGYAVFRNEHYILSSAIFYFCSAVFVLKLVTVTFDNTNFRDSLPFLIRRFLAGATGQRRKRMTHILSLESTSGARRSLFLLPPVPTRLRTAAPLPAFMAVCDCVLRWCAMFRNEHYMLSSAIIYFCSAVFVLR